MTWGSGAWGAMAWGEGGGGGTIEFPVPPPITPVHLAIQVIVIEIDVERP